MTNLECGLVWRVKNLLIMGFAGRAWVDIKVQGRKWRRNGLKLVRHKKYAFDIQDHTGDSKNSIDFVFYLQRSYRGCWISRSITKSDKIPISLFLFFSFLQYVYDFVLCWGECIFFRVSHTKRVESITTF